MFGKPKWDSNYPANVQLLLDGVVNQNATNAPGHAKFVHLPPGTYTILVSAPSGPSEARQITLTKRGP